MAGTYNNTLSRFCEIQYARVLRLNLNACNPNKCKTAVQVHKDTSDNAGRYCKST